MRPGQDATVVAPEGWLLEAVALARLHERLAGSPPEVVGVAAVGGALPPGTSHRVLAEWAAIDDDEDEPVVADGPVSGVVLVRAGVPHDVVDGCVVVHGGQVVVEPRARAHHPSLGPAPSGPAVPEGRPPFPCRPVVVALASEDDAERVRWAASVVDALVVLDVEARVATTHESVPTLLTAPCLPVPASIDALQPDVVLALDVAAVTHAEAWCRTMRRTVVVVLDDDVSGVALVPWRLGVAQGRLRARIGRDVDVAALAALINRLASGPLPGPPVDHEQPVVVGGPSPRRRPVAAAVVAVLAAADPASAARFETLLAHWQDAELEVQRVQADAVDEEAVDAEGLLVVGARVPDALAEVVRARNAAGRRSLVDVRPADLVALDDPRGWTELDPSAEALVVQAGRALFESRSLRDLVELAPVPRVVVATPLAPAEARRAAGLRDTGPTDAAGTVVGWYVGSGRSGAAPREVDVVGDALYDVLDGIADGRVELVGDAGLPAAWFDDERLAVRRGTPTIDDLARWSVALVALGPGDESEGRLVVLRAVGRGIPVVAVGSVDSHESWVEGLDLPHEGAVTDWPDRLHQLLVDVGARRTAAADAGERVNGLVDPEAIGTRLRSLHELVRSGR